MFYKHAKHSRQSALQKFAGYAENASRLAGTVKTIYDVGKLVYGAVQTVAPYAQAAALALV